MISASQTWCYHGLQGAKIKSVMLCGKIVHVMQPAEYGSRDDPMMVGTGAQSMDTATDKKRASSYHILDVVQAHVGETVIDGRVVDRQLLRVSAATIQSLDIGELGA